MRIVVLLVALCVLGAGCTETPSYLPPCVDPNAPCAPYDAGSDAANHADASDASSDIPHMTSTDAEAGDVVVAH